MNIQAPPEAAVPAPSALQATWVRLREATWRRLAVVGSLCLGIAVLLTTMDGGGFRVKLLYSVLIGVACTGIVDATRLGAAWWVDRIRRARGLVVQDSVATTGWRGAVPGTVLALLLGPPIGMWIGDQFTGLRSPGLLQLDHAGSRLILFISLGATIISLVVISTLERLHGARTLAEAAQRQAAETQLRLLQSQLEPHMLFNTLANLRVLVGLDPARAQDMLDHLIAYLRATLSASRTAAHPLATEFQRVDDYLALMAVRMGPRLQVVLDLPEALRSVSVPPMLLQPLVENAIKHGLEPQVQGGRIEVRAHQQGPQLCLSVRDTGVGLQPAPTPLTTAPAGAPAAPPPALPTPASGGFGMAQVRERLATLYGAAASATLAAADDPEGGTVVTLRLPMPPPLPMQPVAPPAPPAAPTPRINPP